MKQLLLSRKYEILLSALFIHLFIGIVLTDLHFYAKVIWPINMFLLAIGSTSLFIQKSKWENRIQILLFSLATALPLILPFFGHIPFFMEILSVVYMILFGFLFYEIISYLIKPGKITIDIISASACGFLLLLEIFVFGMQFLFHLNPESISKIDTSSPASIFIDLVYYCSVVLTTIGFGDILPLTHQSKLLVVFMGWIGQFYTVFLVGVLVGKFANLKNS